MLNSPNEWHNEEEEFTEKFVDDEPDEDFDGSYGDEEYDDESYDDSEYDSDDNAYLEDDDEDYDPERANHQDDDSDDEEDDEEDEEYDDDDASDDGGNKKKIIIAASVLLLLLLLGGGFFAMTKAGKKSDVSKESVAIEQTADETDIAIDESEDGESVAAVDDDGEVSIDVDSEDAENPAVASTEVSVGDGAETDKTNVKTDDESGLQIEVDDTPQSTFASKPGDGTVTVNIGDVGRKNPFMPTNMGDDSSETAVTATKEPGLDFDVIEPPQLAAEDPEISKLLNTKVAGILFDQIRPSAIININGIDQLVRIGDTISGFEIILITKNKVVIQSGNNVYRASVGQPLNAEKIENTVEISNLKTKFYGSEPHNNNNF